MSRTITLAAASLFVPAALWSLACTEAGETAAHQDPTRGRVAHRELDPLDRSEGESRRGPGPGEPGGIESRRRPVLPPAKPADRGSSPPRAEPGPEPDAAKSDGTEGDGEPAPVGTVRGVVVDTTGTAVRDAHLALFGQEETVMGRSDEGGAFALSFSGQGRARLTAESDGVGQADPLMLDLGANQMVDVGELVLRGAGVIGGTVVFPDGTPIVGIPVSAGIAGMPQSPLGLRGGRTKTDSQGRFRITGLAHGIYFLNLPLPPHFKNRHATGELDVLRVADIVRLRITAVDPDGTPYPYTSLALDGPGEPGWVRAYPSREAVWIFPDTDYTVTVVDREGCRAEAPVRVPAGRHEADILVEFPDPEPSARLTVVVQDEQGVDLPSHVDVLVGSGGDRRLAFARRPKTHEEEKLAPGEYELWVYPGADNRQERTFFLRIVQPIQLAPGEVKVVQLLARKGGHVAATVHIDPSHPGRPSVYGRFVADRWEGSTGLVQNPQWVDGLRANERCTTFDAVPPGRWRITFSGPVASGSGEGGFRPVDVEVTVVAGETAEVEVELFPY